MRRVSNNSCRQVLARVRPLADRGIVQSTLTRRVSRWSLVGLLSVVLVLLASDHAPAQTRYAAGQNVVPVFEGWERNDDGTISMVFGYLNRNYQEELDIPVGPNNALEPAGLVPGPDQGQPTHFYTRRQQFVFKVKVPKDWGKKDLVWTLTIGGKTEKAYASLLPFYELGPLVYQENRGATAEIGAEPEPNQAPLIELITPMPSSVAVGQPLVLAAKVTDDGRPTPRRRPAAAPAVTRDAQGSVITPTGTPGPGGTGPRRENPLTQAMVRVEPGTALGVTWLVYRGSSAGVSISPQRTSVHDNKAETTLTFAKPGTYVIRGYADDTVYVTPLDVTVTVR